jgi:hypothetical protein
MVQEVEHALLGDVVEVERVGRLVERVAEVAHEQFEGVSIGEDGVLGQAALDGQVLEKEGLEESWEAGGHG